MTRTRLSKAALGLLLSVLSGLPSPAYGCAACFGKSDSPMAQGMNMGIFSLLAVIVSVLLGVAGFFVFLGRRSGQQSEGGLSEPVRETISPIEHD